MLTQEARPFVGRRGQMTDDSRTNRLRGRVVEGVRLIFVALFGAVGLQLGAARVDANDRYTILYVFLGAACGYVLGGVFGRLTLEAVSGLERELRRRPAAQIAGGVVGLIVGLVIAALLSVPLLFLPTAYAWPVAVFLFIVLGSLGIRLGQDKHEDIFALVGMKPRVSARADRRPPRPGHQRLDRRPRRGPGRDGVHLGHVPGARRRPRGAAGDRRLVRSTAPDPRPSRARRARRAAEVAAGADPAGRGSGCGRRRRGARAPGSGERRHR